jgi:aspartokinase/homoserine dehydrogenase 1
MKVLTFQSGIFSSTEGYQKAIQIILNRALDEKILAVIPADNRTESTLSLISSKAEKKEDDATQLLSELETHYLNLARLLIPVQAQSSVLSYLKQRFNELENIYKGILLLNECTISTQESILCYGSLLSSYIVGAGCKENEPETKWIDARDIIKVDNHDEKKNINTISSTINIESSEYLHTAKILICAAGIARSNKGTNIYLGKGGTDKTAAFMASALRANCLEIWTYSKGMTTADATMVNNVRTIKQLNFEEAMELSNLDSTLFYPPALASILSKELPIRIKCVNNPDEEGTLICKEKVLSTDAIKGISSLKNIALINVEGSGMIGIPGFSKKLFTALNEAEINVILITQSASEHSICVGVHQSASEKSTQVLNKTFEKEITTGEIKPILLEDELSIVALVGDKMKSHPGISGKMFSALGRNGINIRAISQGSNEINISAVIKTTEIEKALNVLHEAFFEDTKKEINLFIIGAGNVGKKLIQQISAQSEKIESLQKIKLNIAGICNSRKMIIDEKGIDKINWQTQLAIGEIADPSVFVSSMTSINLRNSVLVDMTANEFIPSQYHHVLSKSMSVVACNKIAASGNFETYKLLKDLAVSYNCKFLFETNVGAALPIIGTLNDLIKSGDKINKINAVLSGTLNFVFNNYDGSRNFAAVVRQAQEEGYTEPDPRLDLSGKDVMRKIMILVRESGTKIEMDEIACNSFLPASCMEGSVDDFYKEMEKNEAHFKSLLDEANNNNAKLKFVATFNDGKASVGLQHISQENEMYHLYGKDNIVLFHTERYNDQPLVIKGAGAGADVTASGVFADILRSINN